MKKILFTFICLFLIFSLQVQISKAETDASKAKRSIATIKTELRKLKSLRNKSGVRAQLAAVRSSSRDFRDGDSDGLPDIIENVEGTHSCDSDSDDDGIHDGDEERSGSRPDDSSSSEIEIKNTISAITSTTVTVGSYTFTVADNSIFRGHSTLSAFQVGEFVEVSGRIINSVLTLKKLSLED